MWGWELWFETWMNDYWFNNLLTSGNLLTQVDLIGFLKSSVTNWFGALDVGQSKWKWKWKFSNWLIEILKCEIAQNLEVKMQNEKWKWKKKKREKVMDWKPKKKKIDIFKIKSQKTLWCAKQLISRIINERWGISKLFLLLLLSLFVEHLSIFQ